MIEYTDLAAVLVQRNLAHLRDMLRDIWAKWVSYKDELVQFSWLIHTRRAWTMGHVDRQAGYFSMDGS